MSAHKAKQCFDDAKNYVNPQKDPVNWNLVNGLSALSQEVKNISFSISQLQRDVTQIQTELRRLRNQ
jgi:hypothetical protein